MKKKINWYSRWRRKKSEEVYQKTDEIVHNQSSNEHETYSLISFIFFFSMPFTEKNIRLKRLVDHMWVDSKRKFFGNFESLDVFWIQLASLHDILIARSYISYLSLSFLTVFFSFPFACTSSQRFAVVTKKRPSRLASEKYFSSFFSCHDSRVVARLCRFFWRNMMFNLESS